MDILKCLEDSAIIKSFKVEEFIMFSDGFYIRITAMTIKGNKLFISEGKLIARWNNAPTTKK